METKTEKTDDMDGASRHILTLASHDGRALIKKDKHAEFAGHDVGWYELGPASLALTIEVS